MGVFCKKKSGRYTHKRNETESNFAFYFTFYLLIWGSVSGVASIGPGQAMTRPLDMMADLSNQHTAMTADLMMDIISSSE